MTVRLAGPQSTGFTETLAELFRARFPFVYVPTWEEGRLLRELSALVQNEALIRRRRALYHWSLTTGMRPVNREGTVHDGKARAPEQLAAALDQIEQVDEPAVFVLADAHWSLGAHGIRPDAAAIRRIRDLVRVLKSGAQPKNVVFVAPTLVLPEELQKDVNVVEYPLPTLVEISDVLDQLVKEQQSGRIRLDLSAADKERLTKAALGLTLHEAENAFARAIAHTQALDARAIGVVHDEKRQAIRKTGILEYVDAGVGFDDLGGLGNLKQWLEKRNRSWLDEARRYALPFPKGLLVTGVPGCGKSLAAKCVGSLWQLPVLRLDVGRIFSGLVGSSEENMRTALRMAEAVAPSVLWIDEIEKGFSHTTSGLDSGVSSRVFGSFLTWMQEKEAPVFVMATSNSIRALPPEFLRKGRFDEIFFVDLPTKAERRSIFRIHLERRLTDPLVREGFNVDDAVLDVLAESTEGYSGAEIEQIVIAALFEAFAGNRSLRLDDLLRATATTVPLSTTMAEEIAAVREWANLRAVRATSRGDRSAYDRPAAAPGDGDASVLSVRGGREVDF